MNALYQDGMAMVRRHGKPSLFITFTANPQWPEIVSTLLPGQVSADRPDLINRVFKLKLQALMDDITKHYVFGRPIGYLNVIEFQKRGLPHAHILITLCAEDSLVTTESFDNIVCAELPDPEREPALYAVVSSHMMHGPCGTDNPSSPCMRDHSCTKLFPKDFCDTTH